MKTTLFPLAAGLALMLGACGGPSPSGGKTLADCPEVLTVEDTPSGPVSVLHIDRVKDTIDVPLSKLLDDFRMVRLDNEKDEALTTASGITPFDNYFITRAGTSEGGVHEAALLFDKEGRYLCRIGNIGQGPGEYTFVYDCDIDEKRQLIYLMPWQTKNILVYNMQGEYLHAIPLPTRVPKGVFKIDGDKQTITIGTLPFDVTEHDPQQWRENYDAVERTAVVWQQDFQGNVLHHIGAKPYAVELDFSNEVSHPGNIPGTFDFCIFYWTPRNDTLFHYFPDENRFTPVLTIKQPKDELLRTQHDYLELPNHYLIDITVATQTQYIEGLGTVISTTQRTVVLIDKKTNRGAFVRFQNDLLGDIPMPSIFYCFKNGQLAAPIEPAKLLLDIDKLLSSKLDNKTRSRLEELKSTIDPDDNTYLFVGKIKSNAQL